jgi:phosphate transport system substrate-binding protein
MGATNLRTRRGRCVNRKNCPLSRANETFTIEEGNPFVCPVCKQELIEVQAEEVESSLGAAGFLDDIPANSSFRDEPVREPRPKADWPFQVDFSNIRASEEFLRDARFDEDSQSSRPPAPAIRTFDASEHASWAEDPRYGESVWGKSKRVESPSNGKLDSARIESPIIESPKNESPKAGPTQRDVVETIIDDVIQEPMFKSFSESGYERVPLAILLIVIAMGVLIASGFFAVSKGWIVLPGLSLNTKVVPKTILRLTGSNTIGEELMPALAEAFLRTQGATDVHTIAGGTQSEKFVQGVLPGNTVPSQIAIDSLSSARAFTSLADNSGDIGMATRRINPAEAGALKTLGDTVTPENEHVLGLNGLAVLVNASNPIRELPEDKIIKILTGETTKWSTVGSAGGAIKVYAVDDKAGSYDTPSASLLGGKPLARGAQELETSAAVSDAIAADPSGIGVVSLSFIRGAKPLAVSEQDARALLPSHLTVATGEYLLTRRLYLYTHGGAANRFTQPFIEFALSKRGQDLVAQQGFVSQNIAVEPAGVPQNAPWEFRKLASQAQRLTADFHFPENPEDASSDIEAELDRIANAIAELHIPGEDLMLFGFSDNGASTKENLARSLAGAKMLEAKLVSRGIAPAVVKGFGPVLPVAPNDTEEGRRNNRRVEIWIKEK